MTGLQATALHVAGRLAGVDCTLVPGQVTAICGPNGAGKSTLLAALAGLQAPTAGAVALDGRALAAMPARARARQIGYLPQSATVAWNLRIRTLVALGRLPHGTGPAQDRAAVDAALAALDLAALADRPVGQVSGGERARALLARVLAGAPQWILADEPLAALDLAHQHALMGHFRRLAEGACGVVLVVHDLALAMNRADRVIVLDRGRVVADGPPSRALDPAVIAQCWGVTAQWLGEPGARALVVAGPACQNRTNMEHHIS